MLEIKDPTRIYEVNKQVCVLDTACVILGTGNNQQVIAAVTGKRIRVMGWILAATTAATNPGVVLRDGSGGTVKSALTLVAHTVGNDKLPVIDSGYFETTTGTGLYADITTAGANIHIHYIVYTP